MAYFWVNQGKTYNEERQADCLWAPIYLKGTLTTPRHWALMTELRPGDIVFNYTKAGLVSYCEVVAPYVDEPRPYDAGQPYDPAQGGRLVPVTYTQAQSPVPKSALLGNPTIVKFLNEGEPRLLQSGNKRFNQLYLSQLPEDAKAVNLLFSALRLEPPGRTHARAPSAATTTAKRLVDARLGQGKFRADLERLWGGCALTGLDNFDLLIASHIKPWCKANNCERLDAHNGLLLAAGIDRAFDKLLLAIEDDGTIKTVLSDAELECIGIHRKGGSLPKVRSLSAQLREYLKHHRALYEAKERR